MLCEPTMTLNQHSNVIFLNMFGARDPFEHNFGAQMDLRHQTLIIQL